MKNTRMFFCMQGLVPCPCRGRTGVKRTLYQKGSSRPIKGSHPHVFGFSHYSFNSLVTQFPSSSSEPCSYGSRSSPLLYGLYNHQRLSRGLILSFLPPLLYLSPSPFSLSLPQNVGGAGRGVCWWSGARPQPPSSSLYCRTPAVRSLVTTRVVESRCLPAARDAASTWRPRPLRPGGAAVAGPAVQAWGAGGARPVRVQPPRPPVRALGAGEARPARGWRCNGVGN
jgi:hypothetical protein